MIKYLVKHFGFWIGIIFLAAGLFFLSIILQNTNLEKRYSEEGQIVVGSVSAKRIEIDIDKNGTSEYPIISYEFTLPGIPTQNGEGDINKIDYSSINIGDEIKIQYVKSDPKTHRLLSNVPTADASVIVGPMAMIFSLIGLAILMSAIRRATKQTRLWKKGVAIKGIVTKFICDNPSSSEDKFYHITYEYEGPDGKPITGKSQSHSRDWFFRTAEGDTIDIVADPKKPGVSEWRKEME